MTLELDFNILLEDKIKVRNKKSPFHNKTGRVVDIEEFVDEDNNLVRWYICGIFKSGVYRARFKESELQRIN